MRITIERLRTWIVVLALAVVAAILFFLGYAHWQTRRFGRDLPGKLGVQIQQSTNGFTFSKSHGSHTLFTLHAAKAVQYKGGGHALLHDVSVTLYGADGGQADHIYGSSFDYDPASGVARAIGAVEIDLQEPGRTATGEGGGAMQPPAAQNDVHVKTTGLVFNQETGLASTSQEIQFRLTAASGSAIGASFDSQKGLLILDSHVTFQSSLNGSPLLVRARHAQYDRSSRLLYLLSDAADYAGSHSSSDQAIVYFRPDRSAYRVEGRGHVVSTGSDGGQVTSRMADVALDERSRPEQAVLDGGLLYVGEDAVRRLHGTASGGTLTFAPQAAIRHAQLRGAVSLVDAEKPPANVRPAAPPGQTPVSTTRQMEASQVDIDFAAGEDRRAVAQRILANGGARMNIRTEYAGTAPEETTVAGDRLSAILRDGVALSSLSGAGHTRLTMVSPSAVRQSGAGDQLLLTFAAPNAAPAGAPPLPTVGPAGQLQSAVQQGNVTLVREAPAASAHGAGQKPDITTATAQRAAYDAATGMVRLSGAPRVVNAGGELTADTIDFLRATGNAIASGGLKATYLSSPGQSAPGFGGSDPVHVIADHARLDREKDLATFYGTERSAAHLWQGGDSISAPVIELSRSRQTLDAHGFGESAARHEGIESGRRVVDAVFTGSAGGTAAGASSNPGRVSVVRVAARSLSYKEADREAVFRGGVIAQDPSGAIRSQTMQIDFSARAAPASGRTPSGTTAAADAGQSMQVERIVARARVQLQQPGRTASGEQLLYTAHDGKFVLTGTAKTPPRLVDASRGTVSGASLIFNDRDDSVIVSGGPSKAVTETRVAK